MFPEATFFLGGGINHVKVFAAQKYISTKKTVEVLDIYTVVPI